MCWMETDSVGINVFVTFQLLHAGKAPKDTHSCVALMQSYDTQNCSTEGKWICKMTDEHIDKIKAFKCRQGGMI